MASRCCPSRTSLAPSRRYFAAGVTEEVTLQIAKISALRVMSRNAVARFKNPSAQLAEMTRELNIGAVLAGSVRHAGSQVRVSVQLLAAPSGETMWSERYRPHARQHLRRAERHRLECGECACGRPCARKSARASSACRPATWRPTSCI